MPARPVRPERLLLTRRTGLLAAGAVVGAGVAGCSPYNGRPERRAGRLSPRPTPEPGADPDVELAADVLAVEQRMLERIDATAAAFPALAAQLDAVRRIHAAHVELLEQATPPAANSSPATEPTSPTAPTAPSGTSSPSSQPPSPGSSPGSPGPDTPVRVPPERSRAVLAVARAEEELSTAEKRGAFAAESGVFARVLASMAAAAAQQAVLLHGPVPGSGR
ncbi:hypothetical protein [Nocardioides mesophilus]|uniref:DUF4439 domain-containing protein n=1 Tax=Nocardioides mesophilus TaxID=433659 RepID=A0A7G9R9C7_9ACTN|nr:hypothetical protein [Nocardioides mesophilus]QNN52202.1 hypothetical protein H9L09_17150 [Nocardioides mesophilus]